MPTHLSIACLVFTLATIRVEPAPPPELDQCIARIYEALGDEHISPVPHGPTGWTTSPQLEVACDWPQPVFRERLKGLARHANEEVAARAAVALLRYEGVDVDSLARSGRRLTNRYAVAEIVAAAREARLRNSNDGFSTATAYLTRPGESVLDVPSAMRLLDSAHRATSWDAHVFLISRGIVPAGTFIRDEWPQISEADRLAFLKIVNRTWFLCGRARLRLQLAAVFGRRDEWPMTEETLSELIDALLFLDDRFASTLVQHTLPRLSGGQQPDPGVLVPTDGARLLKLTGGLANSTRNRLNLERAMRWLRSPDRDGLRGQGVDFLARSGDPTARSLVIDWYWNERRERCGQGISVLYSNDYAPIPPECACYFSRMYLSSLEERTLRLQAANEFAYPVTRLQAADELLAIESMLGQQFVAELDSNLKHDAPMMTVALAMIEGALESGIDRAGHWIRGNCPICD